LADGRIREQAAADDEMGEDQGSDSDARSPNQASPALALLVGFFFFLPLVFVARRDWHGTKEAACDASAEWKGDPAVRLDQRMGPRVIEKEVRISGTGWWSELEEVPG
jgi:hypothetical protein